MINNTVSIIIPCYNQGQFLEETLQSVLNQSYTDWECLMVNDGSTDNTEEVALRWLAKDSRFKYFLKKNGGVSSTRNFGIEKATGRFIQFLDSDDLLDSRKLELSFNDYNLKKEENVKIVISNFRMFNKNVNKSARPYCNLDQDIFTYEGLLYQWNDTFSIPIHCGFFESSLFENISFPEHLTAQEDWIVWVNLFKMNIKASFIDEPLAFYRLNVKSRTMSSTILPDQLNAYTYFKKILSEEDFHKLSIVLISRYYTSSSNSKKTIRDLKAANTYKGGKMVKKILKKTGLIAPFRYLLGKIEKWNNKAKKRQ
jgi:glycosyltransferase involved in cell wall biosynthesis